MKLYFLSNYTQDLVLENLKKLVEESNIELKIESAGFNQYCKEIINKNSDLYKYKPNAILLSLDLYTLIEDLIYSRVSININNEINERLSSLEGLIINLCKNFPHSKIFIDNFFLIKPKSMVTADYSSSISSAEIIFNSRLFELEKQLDNLKIIDLKSEIFRYGYEKLCDERMYYISKSHWSQFGINVVSNLYFRYIKAFLGKRKKCIVLDLDNTLWGGVIGEDGIENVSLSNDGPAKAYYDFQRELKILYESGILLAINSKNTKSIALDMMINHPYMILKPEHFVSMKINWSNKADNIREIANDINIGTDSMVFLDDSNFERELIVKEFPEIFVPELPEDPSEYPNFLRNLDVFDTLNITPDDIKRNKMYKANVERKNLRKKITNLEDYYFSLNMEAHIGIAGDFQIPRIAQMTQKTNQFNLRTKRYTETEIKKISESSDYEVFYLSLKDKFGDNGIVGTSIVEKKKNQQLFIDSFIFSCRALGRTAETALLNYIIDYAKINGYKYLVGEYIPTKKNMPCKDFYKNHGFSKSGKNWILKLDNFKQKNIPWIKNFDEVAHGSKR
jgi:FkbH-like protein